MSREREGRHKFGDIVLTPDRGEAIYHGDGAQGTYGLVAFLDDQMPSALGLPWADLTATGFWRCPCERRWSLATSGYVRCERCGGERV